MTAGDAINHAADCRDPGRVAVGYGRLGDRLLRCTSCRRFKVLKSPDDTEPTAQPEATAPPDQPARVTRTHPPARPLRRYELACCRCDRPIVLTRPDPRLPLCAECGPAARRRRPGGRGG